MFPYEVGYSIDGVLTGVDDQARLTGSCGDDIAVRGPRTRGEPSDQHVFSRRHHPLGSLILTTYTLAEAEAHR
jgi:hypothetical protein